MSIGYITLRKKLNVSCLKVPPPRNDDSGVFANSGDIESVIIGDGIKTIANNCFNSCSNLKYLYLPATVAASRFDGIFGYGNQFKEIYYGGNDTQWYAYVKDVDEEDLKYIPVYVNSKVNTGSGGIEKGTLYDKASINPEDIVSEDEASSTIIPADEFIASAEAVTYDELRRYPEKYKGKAISIKIKAKDVEPDGWIFQHGMLAVVPGTSNEMIVYDGRLIHEPRIVEGDVIKIYAIGDGLGVIKEKQGIGIISKTVDKYEVPQIVIMKVENDSNTNVNPSVDAI